MHCKSWSPIFFLKLSCFNLILEMFYLFVLSFTTNYNHAASIVPCIYVWLLFQLADNMATKTSICLHLLILVITLQCCIPMSLARAIECPRGFYGNTISLSSCVLCPGGMFCLGSSVIPTGICHPGYYCKEGAYSPVSGWLVTLKLVIKGCIDIRWRILYKDMVWVPVGRW